MTDAMTASAFGPAWSASLRRGSDTELDAWLSFALEAADLADAIGLRHFRHDLEISAKPDRSFVTQADQAIEREIRGRIAERWPGHGVVGEEYGTSDGDAAIRWYLDPIDGTHNFMRGVPLFGLLLAVERDGELQMGVVSAPALGMRWWARRGGGAWASRAIGPEAGRPTRITVSDVGDVADAHLVYGAASEIAQSGRAPGFDALIADVWRDRGFGDFWGYTLVAEAAADAMVEADAMPWDLAAPVIVVEEAGGRMTDFDGRRSIHNRTALASNGRLHAELLRRLALAGKQP